MVITAKFSSFCPTCGCTIAVGSRVHWARGEKARHESCAAPALSAAYAGTGPRRAPPTGARSSGGGRRTGCSCGSRERADGSLIPSDRNCGQCEHDA